MWWPLSQGIDHAQLECQVSTQARQFIFKTRTFPQGILLLYQLHQQYKPFQPRYLIVLALLIVIWKSSVHDVKDMHLWPSLWDTLLTKHLMLCEVVSAAASTRCDFCLSDVLCTWKTNLEETQMPTSWNCQWKERTTWEWQELIMTHWMPKEHLYQTCSSLKRLPQRGGHSILQTRKTTRGKEMTETD